MHEGQEFKISLAKVTLEEIGKETLEGVARELLANGFGGHIPETATQALVELRRIMGPDASAIVVDVEGSPNLKLIKVFELKQYKWGDMNGFTRWWHACSLEDLGEPKFIVVAGTGRKLGV